MSGQGRTIIIAGAGIAGLTLALALAKFGTTVVVLERNSEIKTEGAGLQISPNARKVLNRLGIDKALTTTGLEPEGIDVFPFGRKLPITTLKLGAEMRRRYGAPYSVMHRADLLGALHRACRRFANIDIQLGVENFDLTTHQRGLTVSIDSRSAGNRTTRPFAFVGADGVHSRTRRVLLDGPDATYSGYVAWRTLIDIGELTGAIAMDRTTLLLAPGFHAVAYPLPHRGQVNVAMFQRVPEKKAFSDSPPAAPRFPKEISRSPQYTAIANAAEGNWTFWPANTVSTDIWYDGAVGLIGDAAHAMLPFQAQGAAMGIEDAAILAPLLMTEPNAESAFARYANFRRERVKRVTRLSAGNAIPFHMEWPFTFARDTVLALQGEYGHYRRLDWLYGYDPAPEIGTGAPLRSKG